MSSLVLLCAAIAQLAAGAPRARAPADTVQTADAPAAITAARVAATTALAALRPTWPGLDVEWKADQPGPAVVTGLRVPTTGQDTTARGLDFLVRHPWWAPLGVATLHAEAPSESRDRSVARFELVVPGPTGPAVVLDRSIAVAMDSAGQVLHVVSDAMPVARVPLWRVPAARAARIAGLAHAARPDLTRRAPNATSPRAAVIATSTGATPVWAVDVGGTLDPAVVLVDAASGRVLAQRSLVRR